MKNIRLVVPLEVDVMDHWKKVYRRDCKENGAIHAFNDWLALHVAETLSMSAADAQIEENDK